jgi:hypothetical protein
MSQDTTIPPPPPEKDPTPDVDPVIKFGQELQKAPGFSASLDKAKEAREQAEGSTNGDGKSAGGDKKPDPIAAANAAAKKETPPPAGDKKPALGKRSSSLLSDEKPKDEPNPELKEPKPKKEDGTVDDEPVTDQDIEAELANPHKSEKANKRFRELYRRMREAEGKHATTAKQIQERETKVAELQKQLDEVSKKSTTVDPDIQKKLDEYQMLKRQHDLENDPQIKEIYDNRISASEEAISGILQANRIEFKGMDIKQSSDLIKKEGGFRAFSRKYPEITQQILDALNPADLMELQAATGAQNMLETEKKSFIQTEKGKAKEYFEKQAAAAKEAAANQTTPEKIQEVKKAKIETVTKQIFETADIFKDKEIPADASPEEKKRLSEENQFTDELRQTLQSHLDPQNDDEFVDTAVAATLAHKFKREKTALAARVEALEKELDRVKNAGRTTPRGGVLPPTATPKDSNKPAPSFGAALDLVTRGR